MLQSTFPKRNVVKLLQILPAQNQPSLAYLSLRFFGNRTKVSARLDHIQRTGRIFRVEAKFANGIVRPVERKKETNNEKNTT
jgi:hypothetical protein